MCVTRMRLLTPFLLLTSYLLIRSSPKLHARLLRAKLVGPLLADWDKHRGVRPQVKRTAAATVIAVVAATILFAGLAPAASIAVAILALIGLAVIAALPVAPK